MINAIETIDMLSADLSLQFLTRTINSLFKELLYLNNKG